MGSDWHMIPVFLFIAFNIVKFSSAMMHWCSLPQHHCRRPICQVVFKLESLVFYPHILVLYSNTNIMSFRAPKVKARQHSWSQSKATSVASTSGGILVPLRDAPRHPWSQFVSCLSGGIWVEGAGQFFTQIPILSKSQLQPESQLQPKSQLQPEPQPQQAQSRLQPPLQTHVSSPSSISQRYYYYQPLDDAPTSPEIGNEVKPLSSPSQPYHSPEEPLLSDPFLDDAPSGLDISNEIEPPLVHITRRAAEDPELQRQRWRGKRDKQSSKWTQSVLPALLHPYLHLLRVSESLRSLDRLSPGERCTCSCMKQAKLMVTCVFFESGYYCQSHLPLLTPFAELESLEICYCKCRPAASQLLSRGFSPCAPIAPSLTVDINLLDFARELFLRLPPNNTGWCDTLESFLHVRNHKLQSRVSCH